MSVIWALVHELSRTGAPIALERMIGWAREARPDLRFVVVATHDGPVRARLEQHGASVVALGPPAGRGPAATIDAIGAQVGLPTAPLARGVVRAMLRRAPTPEVVLVHGAGAWALVDHLGPRAASARLVLHLHELGLGYERSIAPHERATAMASPDAILSVTDVLDEVQSHDLGARRAEVLVVPPAVPVVPAATTAVGPGPRRALVIGDAGWRKGTDRAVALAHRLASTAPEVSVVWIGRGPAAGWRGPADASVRWIGPRDDPWEGCSAHDVLVIPSREDPMPLVALEGGVRGLRVVAARTGGLSELLADERGWLVDGWDLRAMAAAVTDAVAASDGRGDRLREHVLRTATVPAVGPAWAAAVLGDDQRR